MSAFDKMMQEAESIWSHFQRIEKELISAGHSRKSLAKLDAQFGNDRRNWLTDKPQPRIYAITCDDFVKIGYAIDPLTRLDQLQCGCPIELELYGSIPGTTRLESLIHRYLADECERYEWFRLGAKTNTIKTAIGTCSVDGFIGHINGLTMLPIHLNRR